MRRALFVVVPVLLFVVPWLLLTGTGQDWPVAVAVPVSVLFAGATLGFPWLMYLGHRGRALDASARIADSMLGAVWVLFTVSLLGQLLHLPLLFAGVSGPDRARIVAMVVIACWLVLLVWGYLEAMRVPRVRRTEVRLRRLGAGLDGTTVVLITDTHLGPLNRAKWSARLAERVSGLDGDIVVHAGDVGDGPPRRRREQTAPLGTIRGRLSTVYVTGNHEYFRDGQEWLDEMTALGWEGLHNRHVVVSRDGAALVVAGIDDRTAAASRTQGHGADLAAALAGTDPELPVLLVAHQPRQVADAAAAGVDLQLSGHTHGGQIWPFHLLVRLDQPSVHGLSRHGERTWLYTSRGSGFWGPPLRIFAPSEISVLQLRSGAAAD